MLISDKCHLKLCTNTISTAYEYGLLNTCKVEFEKTAETSDTRANTCSHCSCNVSLHKLNSLVARCNVYACACVAFLL